MPCMLLHLHEQVKLMMQIRPSWLIVQRQGGDRKLGHAKEFSGWNHWELHTEERRKKEKEKKKGRTGMVGSWRGITRHCGEISESATRKGSSPGALVPPALALNPSAEPILAACRTALEQQGAPNTPLNRAAGTQLMA
jgi:hypothetical protein